MTLILRCLHNSPARRPEAVEILTQVSRVAAQFPPSSQNKVELLQQVRADTERLQQEHEAEIQSLRANTQRLQQGYRSYRADTERLQREHEAEIQSLRANTQRLQQGYRSYRADTERLQREYQACLLGGDSVTKGMQRDLIRKEVCQGKNVGFAKFLSALGI